MNRFVAYMEDDSYINVPADKMEICGNGILAWKGEEMVAYVNMDKVTRAHLSESAG